MNFHSLKFLTAERFLHFQLFLQLKFSPFCVQLCALHLTATFLQKFVWQKEIQVSFCVILKLISEVTILHPKTIFANGVTFLKFCAVFILKTFLLYRNVSADICISERVKISLSISLSISVVAVQFHSFICGFFFFFSWWFRFRGGSLNNTNQMQISVLVNLELQNLYWRRKNTCNIYL